MGLFGYLKSLIQKGTPDNAKSFSMVVSVVVGFITGLCICFVLVYDVVTNGYIKTDLIDLGMFSLCVGGYITGSSLAGIFEDKYRNQIHNLVNTRERLMKFFSYFYQVSIKFPYFLW